MLASRQAEAALMQGKSLGHAGPVAARGVAMTFSQDRVPGTFAASGGWSRRVASRVEDLSDAVLGAGLDVTQMSRGALSASLAFAERDGITTHVVPRLQQRARRPSGSHCAMAVGRLVHRRPDARLRLRGGAGGSRPAAEGDSHRAAVLQRGRREWPARLRSRGVDPGGRGHTGPGAVARLVRGRASVCHRRGGHVLGARTGAVVSRVGGVMNRFAFTGMVGFVALWGACTRDTAAPREAATAPAPGRASAAPQVASNPLKDVYFGNFHVHTMYSFDAITIGCVTDPDAAYRWAKGETIAGGGGGPDHTIKKPLDWYTVSDHAEYLGVFSKMTDPASPLSKLDIAKRVTSKDPAVAVAAYTEALNGISSRKADTNLSDPAVARQIWQEA